MENGENGVIAFLLSTEGSRRQEQFVAGCGHKLTSYNLKGGTTYLRPRFAGGRMHRRRMTGTGFRPEIIVYVLIAEVKSGQVDHLALRAAVHDFSRGLASRFIVIEEKVNVIIALQERNGFVEIGHRVKHNDIEGKCRIFLNGEIRKEIHEALEYQHVLMAVVNGRYVFWGAAALETGGAELSSVTVVLETDSEIRIAVYPIVYLPAITPGDVGIDAPLLDIANKGRMFEWPDFEDPNARFSRSALRCWRDSLNADKAGRFKIT